MSLIEYQPIGKAGYDGRCLSASCADATVSKDIQLKFETLSLPGQLDVVENTPKFTISLEHAKHNNETDTLQDSRTPAARMEDSGCISSGTLSHQSHRTTEQPSTSSTSKLSSNKVLPTQMSSAQNVVENDSLRRSSLSQTLLEVKSVLRQASKIAWAEDTTNINHTSPQEQSSIDVLHVGLPKRGSFHNRFSLKNCTKAFLCFVVALTVFPMLIVLAPMLLMIKLLAVALCCIPCFKCQQETVPQTPPHFFDCQKQGGFYTTVVVLKERMTSKKFVKYIVSKLKDAYDCDSGNGTFFSQLASQARKMCCVSWREKLDKVELDQHINIFEMQISTTNDLTNFLANISKNDSLSKEWMVYFIEKYKNHSSAIVLRAHHSFVSRTLPKSNLIRIFTTSETDHDTIEYEPPRVSAIVKVLQGPGIILSNMLKFSYRLLGSQRLFGKQRFAVSEPISLTSVKQLVKGCDISMYSLFLGALTEAFRTLFRSQNKSLHDITIAIPVHHDSHVSAFFVVLPISQRRQSHVKLLKYFEEQLLNHQGDAQIFLSAAKVASYLLFSCTVNHFTSLVVKQASGIFNIIDCSSNSLYFDDNYVISNVAFWPPLFSRYRIGLSVLCYGDTFKVCIVTDQNVTEWPDLFLCYYLDALSDLYT